METTVSLRSRPTRAGRFSLRRAALGLLAALLALAAIGAAWQAFAEAADRRAFPPPGHLVDVGGHRLHFLCAGEGGPTVVLDHVGAGNSAEWGLVQPRLAADTRVCSYDRAGFGWSDPAPAGPRDALTEARELHTLLHNAGEAGPFLLAGHSYGGRVAKLFATLYPAETAGLVLIDPGVTLGHPAVPPAIDAQWRSGDQLIIRSAPLLSRLGLLRLSNALGADGGTGDLPATDRAAFYAYSSSAQHWDAIAAEAAALETSSAAELAVTSLGELPLLVLSAELPADAGRAAWTTLNAQAATLSQRGEHRVVVGARHMSFAWEQRYADVAADAVREVLATARAGQ